MLLHAADEVAEGLAFTAIGIGKHVAAGLLVDNRLVDMHGRSIEASPRLREKLFYSQPGADERLGEDYDAKGRITAESLLALGAGPDARYMLCGPAAFLSGLQRDLEAAGIPPTSILYETFGPEGQSST